MSLHDFDDFTYALETSTIPFQRYEYETSCLFFNCL